jgi:hypothetical protein
MCRGRWPDRPGWQAVERRPGCLGLRSPRVPSGAVPPIPQEAPSAAVSSLASGWGLKASQEVCCAEL